MCSAYKLNKDGDNIQPLCTSFPIWNQSVVPCPVLTVVFWPGYRFLRRQVRWSGMLFENFPQFVVIHTVKGFGVVNKAEVDVFLELSCFFNDPMDVGNLISGFSAFSKSSLSLWKVVFHTLLKPGLEKFFIKNYKFIKFNIKIYKNFISQKLWNDLPGVDWPGVSNGVAVQILAGLSIIWILPGL